MNKYLKIISLAALTLMIAGCDPYARHIRNIKKLHDVGRLDRTSSLQGVDKNNDGVRDDIERFIKKTFFDKPDYRDGLLALAKNTRYKLGINGNSYSEYHEYYVKSDLIMECISRLEKKYESEFEYLEGHRNYLGVHALHFNTLKRKKEGMRVDGFYNSRPLSGSRFEDEDCKSYDVFEGYP